MLLTLFATVNTSAQDISTSPLNPEEQSWIKNPPIGYDIGLTTEELKWLSENKVIKAAAERDTFPSEFIDLNGNISGIAGDYLKEISNRLNIEFVWAVNDNWNDGLLKIKDHEIEMVATITPTKSREEFLTFTEVYSRANQAIFSSREGKPFPTMESLNGHRIAQVKSTVQIEYLRKDYPDIEIIEVTDYAEALQFLTTGKADALLGDIESINGLASKLYIENFIVTGVSPFSIDNAMGIRNDLTFLASSIQKALADIDPIRRQEILVKWQYAKIETNVDYGPLYYVIGLAVFMALLFFYWYTKLSSAYTALSAEITARKLTEEKLRRSQKAEALGKLSGGIAHDFNNILAVISGNLELMELLAKGDKGVLKCVGAAQKGTKRGITLTKKLLGFSSKEAYSIESVHCNQLLNDMKTLMQLSCKADISLEFDFTEDLWATNVDRGDLEDALLNIVLNARDVMPDGGNLLIETVNKVLDHDYVKKNPGSIEGDFVMVAVHDTGAGMSDEIKSKVTEPFFSTKAVGEGTGLGLSMVQGFVTRAGGYLEISSTLGQGSTFTLFLPKATKEVQEKISQSEEQTQLKLTGDETILVVDDENDLAKVTNFHLNEMGYTTYYAANAEEALAVIEKHKTIDLLFSDVVMPGSMNGFELAHKVTSLNPTIKVLLTSGYNQYLENHPNPKGEQAQELSSYLLKKPYAKYELATSVRKALDR